VAKKLIELGVDICMQKGAASSAHFKDEQFDGVKLIDTAEEPTLDELNMMKDGCVVASFMTPHKSQSLIKRMCEKNITSFAMELVPRITRAQSMDALSSQAGIAGYKGVIMGADKAAVFFPMLTTAAGTIRPARVLIIGAGVAGLQAIATAKRLGAIVEAYDVRSATKEQCESLGAKFVDTGVSADGEGGYARELSDEEKQQQQQVLDKHICLSDVIVTTAAIPGRPSPKIISAEVVANMKVGGNCELTQPGQNVDFEGRVTILGPLNVASQVPVHASEMYAKNLFNLLSPFIKEAQLELDWEDEVIKNTALTHKGEIVAERYKETQEATS